MYFETTVFIWKNIEQNYKCYIYANLPIHLLYAALKTRYAP